MKVETALRRIKAMPDGKAKLMKLYSLAFKQIPNSPDQNMVKAEIDRLYNKIKEV